MQHDQEVNRSEYLILKTLHDGGCKEFYDSMSLADIISENEPENNGEKCALGRRLTVYRRLKKLVEKKYIEVGVIDNHAYTYYITERGCAILERKRR